MTNFKFKSLKDKKIRDELVCYTTQLHLISPFYSAFFISFLCCPRLLRKGELGLEALTEPNLGGSYKKYIEQKGLIDKIGNLFRLKNV